MDIGSFLDIAKDHFPDKPAIISEDTRYTYRQLKDRVQRLTGGLFKLGVKKGDRVAVLMWNSSEMMEVYLAAIRLGAIFTPLNYRLKEPELRFLLKDARPKVLVTDDQCQKLAGHTGEVLVKGPNVMKGYYGKPEQTAKAIKNDWFYSGDLARIDDEGY